MAKGGGGGAPAQKANEPQPHPPKDQEFSVISPMIVSIRGDHNLLRRSQSVSLGGSVLNQFDKKNDDGVNKGNTS